MCISGIYVRYRNVALNAVVFRARLVVMSWKLGMDCGLLYGKQIRTERLHLVDKFPCRLHHIRLHHAVFPVRLLQAWDYVLSFNFQV